MVDTGCLCFAVIDDALVRKHKLLIKEIRPKFLKLADSSNTTKITRVAKFHMDINGHRELIWSYIMPNLAYPIILGKPWMEKQRVIYSAGDKLLIIKPGNDERIVKTSGGDQEYNTHVEEIKALREKVGDIGETGDGVFTSDFNSDFATCALTGAISIHDLNKALEVKAPLTKEEVESTLPKEIVKFADLFLEDGVIKEDKLPPHRYGVDTKIVMQKTGQGRDMEVPWGPLYGMSKEELFVLRKTLTELLAKGWIRASSSPGGAPVLLTKKPGGGLRFCVDYRALNAITERDRYPLPLIRETMQMLSGARWLTKVDVRAAFHRLRIADGDEWKTAFRTRFGSFEWLVTPFGLAGAPAAFQRWINMELGELLGVTCSAYVNDVVIFTNGDLKDHWNKVVEVLLRLQKAGLKLDPRKCEFAKKEIKYLGFMVNVEDGVKVDPEKIQAIKSWAILKDVKGVRSFLGFANFYRSFVKDFAGVSAPLQSLTTKGCRFQWGEEQQQSFEELKSLFVTAPILAMWDGSRPTILETDSSGWATGGCLLQEQQDGILKPIAYYSKKLSPAECNYDIHDKELLAIIRCLNERRSELLGVANPFLILTDHQNLKYFMTSKRLAGKLAGRPDALSRRPQDIPNSTEDPRVKEREFQLIRKDWVGDEGGTGLNTLQLVGSRDGKIPKGEDIFEEEELQSLWDKGTQVDETFIKIYRTLWEDSSQFATSLQLKISRAECTIDRRGALCYRGRLWIPEYEPLRTAIVQKSHDSHLTGHPGRNGTIAILTGTFFWPGMTSMARRFCKISDVCGRSKVWRTKKQGLLLPLPVPDRSHSELSIDFMTELPAKGKEDPKYLMVITDRLLKGVTLEAMTFMNAEECADRFLQCHYRFHGFPKAITSDRGSNWVGDFWARLCKVTGIEQRLSTAFHPETDGATERMNQEVLAYLRAFISFSQWEWATMLPTAQLAINNRDSSVTKISPFYLTHGYHAEPIQLKTDSGELPKSGNAKKADKFVDRLLEAQDFASAAMAAAQQTMEDQANRRRAPAIMYRVGDKVWLNLKNIPTPQPKKKLAWVNAKYNVTRVISPHVVELDVPSKIWPRFHVDLIRKASEDPLPSQLQDDQQPEPIMDEQRLQAPPEQILLVARINVVLLEDMQVYMQVKILFLGQSTERGEGEKV
ncbi:hypothetical protein K3495_g10679 [Podosphaera aphanis]|nr:hypothetical protein K3495_g10679 [Podosphaera aphanis]